MGTYRSKKSNAALVSLGCYCALLCSRLYVDKTHRHANDKRCCACLGAPPLAHSPSQKAREGLHEDHNSSTSGSPSSSDAAQWLGII